MGNSSMKSSPIWDSIKNSFLFRMLFESFKKSLPKEKVDEHGIVYAYGIRRYASILLDMAIIAFILFLFNTTLNTFIRDEKTYIAMDKFAMDIKLTEEEKKAKDKYMLWYMYVGQPIQVVLVILYTSLFWHKLSMTPGKFLTGLRVVDARTFQKISFSQSIKRVFSAVLSVIPIYLGVLWSRFDKRGQSWHDKISGTVVVTNKSLKSFLS